MPAMAKLQTHVNPWSVQCECALIQKYLFTSVIWTRNPNPFKVVLFWELHCRGIRAHQIIKLTGFFSSDSDKELGDIDDPRVSARSYSHTRYICRICRFKCVEQCSTRVMVWITLSNLTKGSFTLDRVFLFHDLSVSLVMNLQSKRMFLVKFYSSIKYSLS